MYLSMPQRRQMSYLQRPKPSSDYCFHYHVPRLGEDVLEGRDYYFFQGNEKTHQYIQDVLSHYKYNPTLLPAITIKNLLQKTLSVPSLRDEFFVFLDKETQFYSFALKKLFFAPSSHRPDSPRSRIYDTQDFKPAVFVRPTTL